MPIPGFSNAQDAISYINNNSGLTQADLVSIANQLADDHLAADLNGKPTIFYSGDPSTSSSFKSWEVAETLGKNSNGQLMTIGQTEVGKLLNSPTFQSALAANVGSENVNAALFGTNVNGVRTNGIIDGISGKLADAVSGDVITISPNAGAGSTYSEVEFTKLLHNTGVTTIDGIERTDLLNKFNALGGDAEALATVRGYVSDVSYAKLNYLQYGEDVNGHLIVGAKDGFLSHLNDPIGAINLPSGTTDIHPVNTWFGDLTFDRLGSFSDTWHFLQNTDALNKLGTAADVLGFSVAAIEANNAVMAGDRDQAANIMLDWSNNFAGGIAGTLAATQISAGALAILPLIGFTPPGLLVGGVMLTAGFVGGYYGGDLSKVVGSALDEVAEYMAKAYQSVSSLFAPEGVFGSSHGISAYERLHLGELQLDIQKLTSHIAQFVDGALQATGDALFDAAKHTPFIPVNHDPIVIDLDGDGIELTTKFHYITGDCYGVNDNTPLQALKFIA